MRRKRGRSDHASWCLGTHLRCSGGVCPCWVSANRLRTPGKSPAKLRAADWPALRHVSHGFCGTYPVKLRYPSDVTDEEWELDCTADPAGQVWRRQTDGDHARGGERSYVRSVTGCQWRAIPKDLPPKSTVYDYFDLWTYRGTLQRIHHALYAVS